MYVVHYFENRNLLLCQLLKRVPSEGEVLRIKGRKGTVASIVNIDERQVRVEVVLDSVVKNKPIEDSANKKKRK